MSFKPTLSVRQLRKSYGDLVAVDRISSDVYRHEVVGLLGPNGAGKTTTFVYGLMVIPFLLVLFLFGIAIGILGSALVLRFGPASEWFIWPIPALLSPFAGVLYPVSTLPHWMQGVSRFLPPAYVFEGLRNIIAGAGVSWALLLGAVCLAVGYIVLAYLYFVKVYRQAMPTGLIARYSAENLA